MGGALGSAKNPSPPLGTVQSLDTAHVTPRVNGRIEAIYFKQGDERTRLS
jgi:multidrug efflux pump subunit AcrA (membrane-fusion protein)